jgi:hypothetical protein
MPEGEERHSKKHRRSGDKDKGEGRSEHKSKKRHKHHDDDRRERKKTRKHDAQVRIVDDDPDDEDVWVEKNIDDDGERVRFLRQFESSCELTMRGGTSVQPLATDIPTAESLTLTSNPSSGATDAALPRATAQETPLKRDDWMLAPAAARAAAPATEPSLEPESYTEDYAGGSGDRRTLGGGVDFFSSLGTEHRQKKPAEDKPDPDKACPSLTPSCSFSPYTSPIPLRHHLITTPLFSETCINISVYIYI